MGFVSLCQVAGVQSMPRRILAVVKHRRNCRKWSNVGLWFRAHRSPRNLLACCPLLRVRFSSLGGTSGCQRNVLPAFYIHGASEVVVVVYDRRRNVLWIRALRLAECRPSVLVDTRNRYSHGQGMNLWFWARTRGHRTWQTADFILRTHPEVQNKNTYFVKVTMRVPPDAKPAS